MKKIILFSSFVLLTNFTYSQWSDIPPEVSPMPMKPEMTEIWNPEVKVVTPGKTNAEAPSDAIVLFDGKNMDQWVSVKDKTKSAPWKIVNNEYFEVVPQSGDIQTKLKFGDCQLHLEWSAPDVIEGKGQGRGNSGVFFQDRYEVQILDNYNNRTYANGQAGSLYKDVPPLVNAMRSPLEWNTYDVIYTAPRFRQDGKIDAPARVTVIHNGVVVQNNTTIGGLTLYIGLHNYPEAHGEDVFHLQDHGNKVQYRNIWVRRL
ncbi:MAG: 3-keto-disaccharide hydrolase [Leadbetterella sp.]